MDPRTQQFGGLSPLESIGSIDFVNKVILALFKYKTSIQICGFILQKHTIYVTRKS